MISELILSEKDFQSYNINQLVYFLFSLNCQSQVNIILYKFCEERFDNDVIKETEIQKLSEDIKYNMMSNFNIICQLTSQFKHFGLEKQISNMFEKIKKQYVIDKSPQAQNNIQNNLNIETQTNQQIELFKFDKKEDEKDNMTNSQVENKINTLKRFKHKQKFPKDYKKDVVELTKYKDINDLAKALQISKKNIERWKYQGITRKKGAGRKTGNPQMEQFLIQWVSKEIVQKHSIPRKKNIIARAKEFKINNFKASKGWCDKFIKRNSEKFQSLLTNKKDLNQFYLTLILIKIILLFILYILFITSIFISIN